MRRWQRSINDAVNWAVGVVNPRRAVVRAHLNRMAEDVEYRETVLAVMRTCGYRSARSDGNQTPWLGSGGSADAHILSDLPALRERARTLRRDDPIGGGLINTFVNNVVGTGLRPQARIRIQEGGAQTIDKKRNARLEEVWTDRKDRLDLANGLTHGEHQRLVFGKLLEDGEVLLKHVRRDAAEPLWFEVVEADRLATPHGQAAQIGSGEIRNGVEKDAAGVPVAYWLYRKHPSDIIPASGKISIDYDRWDAAVVRHIKLTERPGQSRGVPIFHAILQDLHDLDLLLLASLKRVQIAACLAVFIQSPHGEIPDLLQATAKTYGYQLDQAIEPGMIFRTYPEEQVQTLVPNFPTPELAPFIVMLCRRIGAALGVSWQVVLKDFSDSTYSSARTDLLESRQTYVAFQAMFIERCLKWEWSAVMEDARLRGDSRLAGVNDAELGMVQWIPNGWKWIDPVKEAQATKIGLEIGLTTLRDVCAAQGEDWEELLQQRAIEKAAYEAAGLPYPGGATSDDPPPEDDEDETGGKNGTGQRLNGYGLSLSRLSGKVVT